MTLVDWVYIIGACMGGIGLMGAVVFTALCFRESFKRWR